MHIWVRRLFLEVNKVDSGYGHFQALWEVSLKVNKGEMVSVIGSNGAGKTTLLKTIIGLLKPWRGAILFKGERIDGIPTYDIVERGISLVPEGRGILTRLTVLENLELGAYTRRARISKNDTLEEVFSLFPRLKERKNQKAGTLSGGEQQMLALGRALMSRPEFLMMDEPSLGLAPKLVLETFKNIEKLRDRGVTILLVEQNARQALSLCDRAYVLESGRIVKEGTGEELLEDESIRKSYLGM